MTIHADEQYSAILWNLLKSGIRREGRNGATRSLFGAQMRFDLSEGFPLLTTKKVHLKSVIVELLWFLAGETNVDFLHRHGVSIWDEWADANGDLGPVYGKQWRSWPVYLKYPGGEVYQVRVIDQIARVLSTLRDDPFGRRHIVTAWNPGELDEMALPPCHCLFQFYVRPGKHRAGGDEFDALFLDCQLYQRSGDWFLGVPFNIASYALLTHLIARELSMVPGEFIHTFGDLHLYEDHVEQAREQLARAARPPPRISINPDFQKRIFDLEPGDIALIDYNPHPAIKAEVSA